MFRGSLRFKKRLNSSINPRKLSIFSRTEVKPERFLNSGPHLSFSAARAICRAASIRGAGGGVKYRWLGKQNRETKLSDTLNVTYEPTGEGGGGKIFKLIPPPPGLKTTKQTKPRPKAIATPNPRQKSHNSRRAYRLTKPPFFQSLPSASFLQFAWLSPLPQLPSHASAARSEGLGASTWGLRYDWTTNKYGLAE